MRLSSRPRSKKSESRYRILNNKLRSSGKHDIVRLCERELHGTKGDTMNRLIHVGFGNIVNTDKIIAIVSPEAAPIKRLVQKAKETGQAIDATQGRKTKSVLVMENSQVVLSALLPETIAGRAQALWPEEEKEDREDAE